MSSEQNTPVDLLPEETLETLLVSDSLRDRVDFDVLSDVSEKKVNRREDQRIAAALSAGEDEHAIHSLTEVTFLDGRLLSLKGNVAEATTRMLCLLPKIERVVIKSNGQIRSFDSLADRVDIACTLDPSKNEVKLAFVWSATQQG